MSSDDVRPATDDGLQTLRNEAADLLRRGECQDCAKVVRLVDQCRTERQAREAAEADAEYQRYRFDELCKQCAIYCPEKGESPICRCHACRIREYGTLGLPTERPVGWVKEG